MFWEMGCLKTLTISSLTWLDRNERTYSARKHRLIINVALYPSHEMLDVFWSRHFGGSSEIIRVLPQIFKPNWVSDPNYGFERQVTLLICSFHLWTWLRWTEFRDGPIKEIDLVVEVDDCVTRHRGYQCLASITCRHALWLELLDWPLTASHSLRSSPSGSFTAVRRLPLPNVASANWRNW